MSNGKQGAAEISIKKLQQEYEFFPIMMEIMFKAESNVERAARLGRWSFTLDNSEDPRNTESALRWSCTNHCTDEDSNLLEPAQCARGVMTVLEVRQCLAKADIQLLEDREKSWPIDLTVSPYPTIDGEHTGTPKPQLCRRLQESNCDCLSIKFIRWYQLSNSSLTLTTPFPPPFQYVLKSLLRPMGRLFT